MKLEPKYRALSFSVHLGLLFAGYWDQKEPPDGDRPQGRTF